jgi:hypothetical protein
MGDHQKSAPVIGAWNLISFEVHKDGEVAYPFGNNAQGSIIYTASGRFSAQLKRLERPPFASGDQMKGTMEEINANYEGFVSYYGSYEFDGKKGWVIHHVEGSLFPNWEGQKLKRFVELSDNRLTLSTPPTVWGGEVVGVVLWERVE